MARPSSTGGKTSKAKASNASPAKGRKTTKTKRRIASAATRAKRRPVSGPSKDLKEAREQQAATAEILKVIASSPDDVHPVFDAIAASAKQLTRGFSTAVYQVVGDMVHLMAFTPTNAKADEALKAEWPLHRDKVRPLALVLQGKTVQIGDAETADVQTRRIGRARGWRSVTFTPLMNQDACIGFIACTRRETGVLADHHVELLQTFADQAVIAIENTRLFNETQEALERQTVTADILKVIASSPADVQPVFDAIAESAKRLLGSHTAVVTRVIDGVVHFAAGTAENEAALHGVQGLLPYPLSSTRIHARVARTGELAVNTDVDASDLPQNIKEFARAIGWRSMLVVPMLRNGIAIGTIGITRREAGSFDDKTIGLLKTFADQAVIAIANARLFNETKEALAHQTATSDVLQVIGSSMTDAQPVFERILDITRSLVRIEELGILLAAGDGCLHMAAHRGTGLEAFRSVFPMPIEETAANIVMVEQRQRYFADALNDPDAPPGLARSAEVMGNYSSVMTPMIWEGRSIGVIAVAREPNAVFSEKELHLLQTFADQAVIAIQNVRLFNETKDALARQTATADVLKVIASSPSNLQPVFDAIAERSNELMHGHSTTVFRLVGNMIELAAFTPVSDVADAVLRAAFPRPRSMLLGLDLAFRGEVQETIDAQSGTEPQSSRNIAHARGFRGRLVVPLKSDSGIIGAISITRKDPGAFTEKDKELLRTFADQAVIAIENVRLFDEVQAKTRDLSEALTYQTGSANILNVIASSPTDIEPVLNAIVEGACELCEANDAAVLLKDGEHLRFRAHHGPIDINLEKWPITRGWTAGRAFLDGKPVHLRDTQSEEAKEFPDSQALAVPPYTNFNVRTVLSVPLLRESERVGAILLRRIEMRPFSDKQIALLQTFADQAVIAINNARLFDEVQAKTRDLTESLQQQTATSDVLKVISRSAFDLQMVLDTLVESAARLCDAHYAMIFRGEGDTFKLAANHGFAGEYREWMQRQVIERRRGTLVGRTVLDRKMVHIPDAVIDPDYTWSESIKRGGFRTMLGVPLLREGTPIGVIALCRSNVSPFTDRQIELVTTFADQAVIAIENVRLFDETQQALEQQTATADILKVIASSPDDVQPVFQAIAERSNRIVEGLSTAVVRLVDDTLYLMAYTPVSPDADAALQAFYPQSLSSAQLGDAIRRAEIVQIADSEVDFPKQPAARDLARKRGWRSALFVPLLRDRKHIGMISVTRVQPGRFADHHVQLLQTFADQAVIAISNVELFQQVQERTRELSQSLDDLRTAQDRLIQTEKLASLGQLTAGIAHEIKNPLNFVNNFSALSAELTDELNDVLRPVAMDGKVRGEVDELTGLLKDNLEKVVQHGKRADSIVKNMLLHSREGSREHRPADINSLLDESLNLAYHGARAEKGEFNIALQRDFDANAGTIELFPQEITRALLNLIANGVYAATRRKTENNEPGFEPTLRATTKNLGTTVEIRIRDNGTGIPAEVREKMFNPFFTTKPAGEGTGLGLSMTHDIIVKQHGGRIDVETEPGQFTEFTIVLPRKSNVSGRDRGGT